MATGRQEQNDESTAIPKLWDSTVIAFGLTVVVLVIGGLLGFVNASWLADNSKWVAHTHEVIIELEALLSTLKDAETGQRGYLLTGDLKYLQPYDQAIEHVQAELTRLDGLMSDNPDQKTSLVNFGKKMTVRLDELNETVALLKAGDRPAALEIVLSGTGKALMDDLRSDIATMKRTELDLLEKRNGNSVRSYRITVLSILLSSVIGVVLVGIVFQWTQWNLRQQKKSAKILAEKSERLRITLASIGDGVITTDSHGCVTNMNAVAESLTGWKNHEAISQPLDAVFQIVHESTRNTVENPATRALREGIIVGLANHTVLIAKDGTERFIDDSASPIRWADGEIIGCVLVFRDISEQRQADHQRSNDAARIRSVMNHAIDGIIAIDDNGTLEAFNPAAERLFNYKAEEVIGQNVKLLIPEPFHSDHDGNHASDRDGGQAKIIGIDREVEGRRKDGSTFPMELGISEFHVDNSRHFTGIVRDISERKRAEAEESRLKQQLQERVQELQTLLEILPVQVWIGDAECKRITGNAAAYKAHGFPPGINASFNAPLPELPSGLRVVADGRELLPHEMPMQLAARTGKPVAAFEHDLVHEDGRRISMLANVAPLLDDMGNVRGVVGAYVDITERKRMETELRQYAAELSEADRRKNEFLAMLAHELRNPLAPIRNAVQILRMTDNSGEVVQSTSEMMDRQVSQMVRLVDDLLDVSRITRGKIALRKERIELASIVHNAVEACRHAFVYANDHLTVTLPQEPISLIADPTRLAQVLGNLLNNACKFTGKRGHISLTVERDGEQAIVRVRDEGVGIAADQLPHIFEMFMQVDTSLERSASGLGIGLTLVKSLVELHGGTVEAYSAGEGHGSEFVVRLPILTNEQNPAPTPPMKSLPAMTCKFLVVDDNRDSATTLALLLKMNGHQTHVAFDGLEAVEAAATFRPDVILLDIGLPKLNGYEVCRRIREQTWGMNIVIIALTGWGQEEDRERSRAAGFNGHSVKPVDLATLTKLVSELRA